MKLTKVFKTISNISTKYQAQILTGTAVVGVIVTAVMAYKAAPKAQKILEEHKKRVEKIDKADKKATRKEVLDTAVKMVKPIAPPVIMGGVTIGCILGSHSVSSRRIAALSAAYSISESALKDLDSKMKETLGENKTKSIKDAIIKDKVKGEKALDSDGKPIVVGDGDCICKDGFTGRIFRSNAQKIGMAINAATAECMSSMYVSLNEFYEFINAPGLYRIPKGDDLGWNVDDCFGGVLPITYSAVLLDDGRPCLYIDYDAKVREDYRILR